MPSRRDALGLCGGALLGPGLAGYIAPESGRTGTARTNDGTNGPNGTDTAPTTEDQITGSPEPRTGIEVDGGSLAWERAFGEDLVSGPAFADGTELWRATLSGGYPPIPAAGPDGGYVATTAGGLETIGL